MMNPPYPTQSMLQLDTQAFLEEEEQYAQLQRIRPLTAEHDYHNYNLISQNLRLFTENDNPNEVVIFSESLEDLLCIGLHRQSRDNSTSATTALHHYSTNPSSNPTNSSGGGVMTSILNGGMIPTTTTQLSHLSPSPAMNYSSQPSGIPTATTTTTAPNTTGGTTTGGIGGPLSGRYEDARQLYQIPSQQSTPNTATQYYAMANPHAHSIPQQQQSVMISPTVKNVHTIQQQQQQQQHQQQLQLQQLQQQQQMAMGGVNHQQKFKFVNFNAPNDGISQDLLRQEQMQETMPAPIQKKSRKKSASSSNPSASNTSSGNSATTKKSRRASQKSQSTTSPRGSPKNSPQPPDDSNMFGKFSASSDATLTFLPFTPNQKKR